MNTILWLLSIAYLLVSLNMLSAKAGEMLERPGLSLFWRAVAEPWSRLGLAFSVALNLSVGWLLFLERPLPIQEWTFSDRVRRHYWFAEERGPIALRKFRVTMARWWHRQLNSVRKGHI